MPSKKRTVKYEENVEPDGDKSVEVSEEQSIHNDQSQEEVSESEDERYNAASGN